MNQHTLGGFTPSFEALLARLSANFIHLPAEGVDGQIERGLGEVVSFLGIDRCSLGQFSADGRQLVVTHSFTAPGFPPMPRVDLAPIWPWYTGQIRRGAVLRFSRLPDEFPAEAAPEREHTRRHGPRSHLAIPFRVGGENLGGIGFATLHREVAWPDELVARLQLVSEVFANALARKAAGRKGSALRERMALADAGPDDISGTWVFVLGRGSASEVTRLFLPAGWRVREFASEAEFLREPLGGPGCAVIDLDEVGPGVLDALTDRDPPLPVVFLTARADVRLSVRAMKAGAIDVLARPFDELALQEAVARGVQRHTRAIRDGQEVGELCRRHDGLSPRECEVMALVVTGLANKVVAARLGIREKTVKIHRGAVMRKMRADSLAGLVRMADRLRSGRSSSAASC